MPTIHAQAAYVCAIEEVWKQEKEVEQHEGFVKYWLVLLTKNKNLFAKKTTKLIEVSSKFDVFEFKNK